MNPRMTLLQIALGMSLNPKITQAILSYKNHEGFLRFEDEKGKKISIINTENDPKLLQSDLELILHIFGVAFESKPVLDEYWEISLKESLPIKVKELEFKIPECSLKITSAEDKISEFDFDKEASDNLRMMFTTYNPKGE